MVSGQVAERQYPIIHTASLIRMADAFSMKVAGYSVMLKKTIMFYPNMTYRVQIYVPVPSDSGQELRRSHIIWHHTSRPFDTLEQAEEVYNYLTSNLKYLEIAPFAKWKNTVLALMQDDRGNCMGQIEQDFQG